MSAEDIYIDWIEAHTIEDERGVWFGNPDDPEENWVGPFPSDTDPEFVRISWDSAMYRAIDAMCP